MDQAASRRASPATPAAGRTQRATGTLTAFPTSFHRAPSRARSARGRWQHWRTIAGMVAVITATLAGSAAGLVAAGRAEHLRPRGSVRVRLHRHGWPLAHRHAEG